MTDRETIFGYRMRQTEETLAEAVKMEKVIYKHGWDGAWFVRAYDDFGKPIGSKKWYETRSSVNFLMLPSCVRMAAAK